MKYLIVLLVLLMLSPLAIAKRFATTVHSIDFGKARASHLVRFDNGRVAFVKNNDQELISSLISSNKRQEKIEVEVDKKGNMLSAQSIGPGYIEDYEEADSSEKAPFQPTVVKSYNSLLKIFKGMRRDYKTSGECFNRAHIWAHEEFNRSGLQSMKVFMFFTERYIRKYKYHWWFHVTPMAYWKSLKSPRALDRRYTSGPRQTKNWSDTFIKSKKTCKIVKKFDDYWLNQQKQDCYHIYTSMYYVTPRDIEKRDLTGIEKEGFNEREIRRAYQNAFKQ